MKLNLWPTMLLMLFFAGCTSSPSKLESSAKRKSDSYKESTSPSPERTASPGVVTEKQQSKNDIDRILEKKNRNSNSGLSFVSNPQNKMSTFTTNPHGVSSASQLYDQLVYQYEIHNSLGFQQRLNIMHERFPKAPEMADSLYLAGLLQMADRNYGKSLQYLSQVQTQFPLGRQIAGVMYTKGLIYKKMDLTHLAKNNWNQVIEKFPGSPEAAKAKSELRLVR